MGLNLGVEVRLDLLNTLLDAVLCPSQEWRSPMSNDGLPRSYERGKRKTGSREQATANTLG
jgi:hypothetical protein